MKSEWLPSVEKLNGKQTVQHRDNCFDIKIFGRYGFLTKTKALVDNHKVYNKLASLLGVSYRAEKGEEVWLEFPKVLFNDVYKALKIPRKVADQIRLASRFSTPLKQE